MNLSELIRTHKGRRSYADIERDCGGYPSAKRIQQLATQSLKNYPDPPTIRALAVGLRVPELPVILAISETLNLDVTRGQSRLLDLLPARVDTLTDDQIRIVTDMVRSFVTSNTGLDAQRSIIREVVLGSGVRPVPIPGEEESDLLDRLVDGLIDEELRRPGSIDDFRKQLEIAAERNAADVEAAHQEATVYQANFSKPSEPDLSVELSVAEPERKDVEGDTEGETI